MKQISGKLILGLFLFVFGLAVAKTGTQIIEYGSDASIDVCENPSMFHPFWVPISYSVIQTPDYSFSLLTIGVFMTTTGFWTIIEELKSRNAVKLVE